MFNISKNGIITLSRGDSFSLDVFINVGTALNPVEYTLDGDDKLYFALCEPNQPFECAIIRKEFNKNDATEEGLVRMVFDSEMTECLMPGTYFYTVKLVTGPEDEREVNTIISKTKFYIID